MFGMRYAIDVVFLDASHRVLRTVEELAPGRVSPRVKEATSVLELPAGTVARTGLAAGTQLAIEGDVPVAQRSILAIACNVSLALLFAFFAAAHVGHGRATGAWTTIVPVVLQELLLVVLFLARRQSVATSGRPEDWIMGIVGTFAPLLMRPAATPSPFTWIGVPIQILGVTLSMIALVFLGRSVGVVAANRGVKTAGPYRLVRHPMYVAHLVGYLGYVCSHPTLRNFAIVATVVLALGARATAEERFLSSSRRYRAYLRITPWRFIPGVY
jgi:protein-S-isoprenylcysteine O-methyltransferase Ste14